MQLYLHIGTEKTGSSYLQSMMALNRKFLQQNGIRFPLAGKRERQMLEGEISAGNAQPLADAIEKGDFDQIHDILQKHLAGAQRKGCGAVLLSNETIVLALSGDQKVKAFQQAIKQAGYSKAQYLLILRDPVDQALSLYKHRAKSGTAPHIEEWPQQHYHYGKGLNRFFKAIENADVHIICRKYDQQKGHLEKVFFQEWLGIEQKFKKPSREVNPSLSISELLLIKQLRQQDIWLPGFLYERLLDISRIDKAYEPRITEYYKAVLYNHQAKYTETWKKCNQHLPEGEQLEVPAADKETILTEEKVMTFSAKQGKVLAAFMKEAKSPKFKLRLKATQWRRRLGRLKNRFLHKS